MQMPNLLYKRPPPSPPPSHKREWEASRANRRRSSPGRSDEISRRASGRRVASARLRQRRGPVAVHTRSNWRCILSLRYKVTREKVGRGGGTSASYRNIVMLTWTKGVITSWNVSGIRFCGAGIELMIRSAAVRGHAGNYRISLIIFITNQLSASTRKFFQHPQLN